MKKNKLKISVVIPVYNEAESVPELYTRLKTVLAKLSGKQYELIFIDDGSNDSSFEEIQKVYKSARGHVRAFRFKRNFGKAAALSKGFEEARGDIVITIDSDLQDLPEEIPKFIEKLNEGYDLVSGWKQKRKDPLNKTLPSKLFNLVTGMLTGTRLHDLNCGMKAYRSSVVKDVRVYGELHRYIPVLAKFKGYKIAEVRIKHAPRKYGKSKYGMGRFLKGFFDLLTVLFLNSYLKRPMHLFGLFGIVTLTGGVGINAYITYLRLMKGDIAGRYPLLFLGVLLMIVGVQFITTGLLGEMLANMNSSREEYSLGEELESDALLEKKE